MLLQTGVEMLKQRPSQGQNWISKFCSWTALCLNISRSVCSHIPILTWRHHVFSVADECRPLYAVPLSVTCYFAWCFEALPALHYSYAAADISGVAEPAATSGARAGQSPDVQQRQQLLHQAEPLTSEQTPSSNTVSPFEVGAGIPPQSASRPRGAIAHQSASSPSDSAGSFDA